MIDVLDVRDLRRPDVAAPLLATLIERVAAAVQTPERWGFVRTLVLSRVEPGWHFSVEEFSVLTLVDDLRAEVADLRLAPDVADAAIAYAVGFVAELFADELRERRGLKRLEPS